jgi:hypothetical protein
VLLVVLPALRISLNKPPLTAPYKKCGFFIGFVATFIEYLLFIIVWLLEDWGEMFHSTGWGSPTISILMLGSFVIGWVTFGLTYHYASRMIN